MKKVYVQAYLNNNLGDDLFIHMLVQRYKNIEFYICGNPRMTTCFKQYGNVHTCSKMHWIALKIKRKIMGTEGPIIDQSAIDKCEAAIRIGGSIFIEYDKWEKNWVEFDMPYFIISANYGPARSQDFHDLVESKLKKTEGCCFRDMYSYKQFMKLKNVSFAPDVVFGFNPYGIIEGNSNPKGIAISLIDLSSRKSLREYSEEYYSAIARVIDHFTSKAIPVTMISFCLKEGDKNAVMNVINRCQSVTQIRTIDYDGNYIEVLRALESCDTVIATRFHAMVLGWIMGKNVVPIVYSNKQDNVMDDLSFKGPRFYIESLNGSSDDIICACEKREGYIENIKVRARESESQFADFEEYCSRG
ncbi:MAG: polysaccharide pyruvyl transferase family protein [Clostridia bacterium]|nr:polysaccharide pyruvyl transferase family protein [Clostridia bacterium]